jgi:DNA polymerase-4
VAVSSSGPKTILHVDMDAFFASVEQRDDTSLRGKPVIVGGPSRRGVVCAASYEARPFGVRSAMPIGEALRRCPQALVVPPRRDAYEEASGLVFSIFRRYTPLVQGLSLDEAFLDVTGSAGLFGDGVTIARAIKAAIFEETRLRASAGVGPTKFTAKIASDLRKPDGLYEVPPDVPAFLAPLPIDRIWGVGPKTADVLRGMGLRTIGHVASADVTLLESLVGASQAAHLHALARGHDPREVVPDAAPKSIGAEETYEHDVSSQEILERHLLAQSERVCRRALREGWEGRVVVLKVKMADFSLKTRRTTLEAPARDTSTLFVTVRTLLRQLDPLAHGGRVRLSGVALQGLAPSGSAQRTLFPDVQRDKRETLEKTMLRLADRFGGKVITRADTLLADEGMGGNDPRRRS